MAGSSTCLNAAVPEPLDVLAVTHYPHVVPGPFTTETGINTTGAAVAWLAGLALRRTVGTTDGGRLRPPRRRGWRPSRRARTGSSPCRSWVTASGPTRTCAARSPGCRCGTVGRALARAVLEGVAFAIADQLELLRAGGARSPSSACRAATPASRSWTRIKADVLGIPVRTVPGDAAVTGVAMLAGLGAGVYRDPAEAIAPVRPTRSADRARSRAPATPTRRRRRVSRPVRHAGRSQRAADDRRRRPGG